MFKYSFRFLIALCLLFLFVSLIQDSYAKYLTSADATTNFSIARWNILVNTQDIIANNDFSTKINPIFPGNTNTSSGIIAPLSEGYFDLVVDYTNVDVSFKQTIKLKHADTNTLTDMVFSSYSINGGANVGLGTTTPTITDNIAFSDTTRIRTYRIYVKWIDGAGETMDNEADTEATRSAVASAHVDIAFEQIPH